MSRHRNVRTMNYDEDYEGYDDVYGHSLDDDYGTSPGATQYLYDRSKSTQIAHFVAPQEDDIAEEPEEVVVEMGDRAIERTRQRLDSLTIDSAVARLAPDDEVLLKSCLDAIHDVVGDSVPENIIIAHILQTKFDSEKALDNILSGAVVDPSSILPQDTLKKPRVDIKPPKDSKVVSDKGAAATSSGNTVKRPEPIKVIPASKAAVTVGFDLTAKERSSTPTPGSLQLPDSRNSSKCPSPIPSDDPSSNTKLSKSKEFQGDAAINEYSKERGSSKDLLNLLVIGHVDAGKSTLMGHLLYQLGQVPKKTMHKFEQESKKLGKQSFMYAWVLDETGEERTRGITMDVGQSKFETDTKSIVLLDAPGHKDFIPNMITGASQADVAVLVVDSTTGEFETGFESGGQTREHALLVRSLGVNQLVVAVNKLDNMDWSVNRFEEIRIKLTSFLVKQAGFRESDITTVPCSGLIGENLTKTSTESKLTTWYSGPTLLTAIDSLRPPERPVGKPLRITLNDVFKGPGGLSIGGRIETGMVQAGEKVLIQPIGEVVTVKGITLEDGLGTSAFAGDPVLLSLHGYSDPNVLYVGCVLTDPSFPCKVSSRFQARVVTFDAMTIPLTRGFTGVIHIGSMSEQVSIKKLISHLNKGTGEVIKIKPRCLSKNSNGIVELESVRPVCLEEFKDVKELGRFTLRSAGVTIAAGVITLVL